MIKHHDIENMSWNHLSQVSECSEQIQENKKSPATRLTFVPGGVFTGQLNE